MFILSTKPSEGALRITDLRTAVTLDEAQRRGDQLYKNQHVRIWKVFPHDAPVLVAEKSWRNEGQWTLTKRGMKLLNLDG